MRNIRGAECWLIINLQLIHGHVLGEDVAFRKLAIETDSGDLLTVPRELVLLTPAEVRGAIADQVRKLAQISEQFDRQQAVLCKPRQQVGERYGTIEV